jgi:hypothetical protein
MPDQKTIDQIAADLQTIDLAMKNLSEHQKVLNENQKVLLEAFDNGMGSTSDLLRDISERLDQIEKTIYADDWARRTGGK